MGEIADSLIDGEFDFFTGEYIGRGVGYPRTINKSLPWEQPDLNIKTITNWFAKHGIKTHDRTPIIMEFIKYKGWVMGKKRKYTKACLKIQENMTEFEEWFKQHTL